MKGTPNYMAPEIFISNGYLGVYVDIFAMGVILFSLVFGRPPFRIASMQDNLYKNIVYHDYQKFWTKWETVARD
jgi:serine/threonine protein kinase